MGAVEHLKTYCCLGLAPESAMLGIQSLLHEIVPHDWSHVFLCEPDGTVGVCCSDHPASTALFRERLWRFVDDPAAPLALWDAAFRATGIGWTLPRQGRGWFDNAWYRELEAPLESCWMLDAMIGGGGRTIAGFVLRRPRRAAPFTAEDVAKLDRLRPWLGHALRPQAQRNPGLAVENGDVAAGEPIRRGQMLLTPGGKLVFQSAGVEFFLRILYREPANYLTRPPRRDILPAPIALVLRRICRRARDNGVGKPPRLDMPTPFGTLTLDADWLAPAGVRPEEAARDPGASLISVTMSLRENAVAHAARVLREGGATPAQVEVGIRLALGQSKARIAQELGLQESSVADQTKKLYRRLDIHTSSELGFRLWGGNRTKVAA